MTNRSEDPPWPIAVFIVVAVFSAIATCAAVPVMAWRFAVGAG